MFFLFELSSIYEQMKILHHRFCNNNELMSVEVDNDWWNHKNYHDYYGEDIKHRFIDCRSSPYSMLRLRRHHGDALSMLFPSKLFHFSLVVVSYVFNHTCARARACSLLYLTEQFAEKKECDAFCVQKYGNLQCTWRWKEEKVEYQKNMKNAHLHILIDKVCFGIAYGFAQTNTIKVRTIIIYINFIRPMRLCKMLLFEMRKKNITQTTMTKTTPTTMSTRRIRWAMSDNDVFSLSIIFHKP